MNQLQEKIFDILKWFDGLCRQEGLRYYAIGGTFLGAVRHKGFIPWDDDADVGMPRADYEKLIRLFSEQKDGMIDKYLLETIDSSDARDFFYTYGKLYDTTTTMTEIARVNCRRGVYLDIFPLDGVGDTPEDSLRYFRKRDRLNMFLATRVCAIRGQRSFYKNAAIVVSRMIPSVFADEKKIARKFNSLCKERDFDSSKYVCNLSSTYRSREIIERRLLGMPTEYEFEGISILGPEQYDEYLTHIFGDWRQLPPKEKQVAHHDFTELDLNRSFLGSEKELF